MEAFKWVNTGVGWGTGNRHAVESAGLLCDQSGGHKTPPAGSELEAVGRLEVAGPGGTDSVLMCIDLIAL